LASEDSTDGAVRSGRRANTWTGAALRIFLPLAAAGLLLVTAFVLFARVWWVFDLFTHFRVQYFIVAVVLAVTALLVRAYPSAAVFAAIALGHGLVIKNLWLGDSGPQPGGTGVPLRVISANVLESNRTPARVLDLVRRQGGDIVILIEADRDHWHPVLAEIGALYPHRAPETWSQGGPILLFSRFPILRHETIKPPRGLRPYLEADVAVDERIVTVLGVHPSSPTVTDPIDSRQRNHSLNHIARNIEDRIRPLIVAGDFNITPWSPHFRDLIGVSGLRNAAEGQGLIATWPRQFWPLRVPIDHVLVRGPIAVHSITRGPSTGSDHFPVIADLRLLDR
jgi:endonuclease/exonuclease/phosphatase (EEP) superfamily protein YafD